MTLLCFQARSRGLPLSCLYLLSRPYCAGHLSVQLNGCDATPPGFVIITFPGRPWHTFFLSLNFVGFVVPGATSKTLIFFGVTPPTVIAAPSLMFVPVTSRKNAPDSARSNLHPVTTAMSGVGCGPGVVELAHEKGRKITFDDQGFSVQDENGNTVKVDSSSGAMILEARGALRIRASSISIEAAGTLELKAGATLTIRGSLVNIN